MADTASVVTEKSTNCSVEAAYETFMCLVRLRDFGEKVDQLDMDKKNELREFERSCDSLNTCFSSLRCRPKSNVNVTR